MQRFISESQIRREICDCGQKMYDKGFVAANDGNISARIDDNIIIVTPTGVSKGGMSPDSLVKMDLDGNILSGNSRPSSEVKMHIEVYRQSRDIMSVVHAHPPMSTAFAVARRQLDKPILSEAICTLGVVPVADYATPGTDEVPQSISPYVRDFNAVLLANHGLLTWGQDITQAFFRMESVEQYAKIMYYLDKIGEPQELKCDKVEELVAIRENMGITTGGTPPCQIGDTGKTQPCKVNSKDDDMERLIMEITDKVMQVLKEGK